MGRVIPVLVETAAPPGEQPRRPVHRRFALAMALALSIGAVANPARAVDGPIFLFGGSDLSEFLGCLNCYRSEIFSVWNESGEFGSPTSPISIWNRYGVYGSVGGAFSPWNPRASNPPVAVDRSGQLYGYFTLNPVHPDRVRYNETHSKHADFYLLAWLLENFDWVATHLEDMREQFSHQRKAN